MAEDRSEIIALLRDIYLFHGSSEADLVRIAELFKPEAYPDGKIILKEGSVGDAFFIVMEGMVTVSSGSGEQLEILDRLGSGDFFGEDALLFERTSSVAVTADGPVTVLRLESQDFYRLLEELPHLKPNLAQSSESDRLARQLHFGWLKDDEVIYQIRRKHKALLVYSLLPPFVVALVAVVASFWISGSSLPLSSMTTGFIVSAALLGMALLWGGWRWLDWTNDFYIITNQRVVWVEHIIGIYDSRDEVPLSTVQSIDISTGLIGRQFGYGDVIIRTYTGQMVLRFVGEPEQFAEIVEQYWRRVQSRARKSEIEMMDRAIRERLGLLRAGEAPPPKPPPPPSTLLKPKAPRPNPPGIWEQYFSNFFTFRFENGNVITYRKYWPVLIGKTLRPGLLIILVTLIAGALLVADWMLGLRFLPPSFVVLLTAGALLILLPWWFYHYLDWRNDIYQVTDRQILDIERKPFGTESRKSAPIENILSLEHKRLGLLGYMLNYGSVYVKIGETEFDFEGMFDPARVQNDIFNRMYELRRRKAQVEEARERERLVEVFDLYHHSAELKRQNASSPAQPDQPWRESWIDEQGKKPI
jgi:membrane protein YdbS with pleckstrin-like domain